MGFFKDGFVRDWLGLPLEAVPAAWWWRDLQAGRDRTGCW